MRGWILDLYPGNPGEMVVWLKLENGEARRLVDRWSPSIFVASDDGTELARLSQRLIEPEVLRSGLVEKLEQITDRAKSKVLEVQVRDAKKIQPLARRIEDLGSFGVHRIYNADVPPAQTYLYEHDLFPLAYCEVSERGGGLDWRLLDDVWSYDYVIPEMRETKVEVEVERQGRIARHTDPIRSVKLTSRDEEMVIESGSEQEKILELVKAIGELDPDLLLTEEGDTFLLPYMIERAVRNGVHGSFFLDRDRSAMTLPSKPGTSYFSYGKILFKPSAMKLCGRVHLDLSSSFVCSGPNLEGLFELSRICRMPLQTASRASIGKALSSLQFYHASKMDLLVPWKPVIAEKFKDRWTLMVADRGGFIFEPRVGLFEGVGELDFSSLYPNIMLKKNLSAETVRCPCCPDSSNRIPELDWNVCEKQVGIVPRSIKIIVGKRLKYKELKKNAKSKEERERYDARQSALKWLGVTCLPPESPVFVRANGRDKFVRIGEFIDELAGNRTGVIECPPSVFVAGLDRELKARFCRVARLIKKPNDQKLVSVRMEDGREVVTTPDHPFFTLHEGKLEVRRADELRAGEVVPVAKRIPAPLREVETMNLVESMKSIPDPEEQLLWRVSGNSLSETIRANKERLVKEAVTAGYTLQAVNAWIRNGIIPLRFFVSLNVPPESQTGLRIGVGRRLGGRIAWLPAVLTVDESLGFFLGMFVADGSATRNYVRLDIRASETDLLETTRKITKSLFGISPLVYKERKAEMYLIQINSASLVKILERVFGLPASAGKGKLKVPDVIFNSSESAAVGFMEGLIAGDGSVSKSRRFIGGATKSYHLKDQLGFLAARLGLTFRIAGERDGPHPLYTVNFVGPETLGKITDWNLLKYAHGLVAQSWTSEERTKTCTHARYERLPVEESTFQALAKATRTSSNPHVWPNSRMCPVKVREKISKMSRRRLTSREVEQISKIEKLVSGDAGFARVRSVKQLDSRPDYVYCFQVEDEEAPGFVTGDGLVFVHNCFGYLGFNNAKFGRIDAHIGVCAWDRKVLLDSAKRAEREGFRVIHGIVDSLWLKREGAAEEDYQRLRREIEEETNFEIAFEGIYKWVVFLPSRVEPGVPVLNRYFGAYKTGELKVRGVEARRHDTPILFSRCQMEILSLLAKADSIPGARELIPECLEVFAKYAGAISDRMVPPELMLFTRNLSKKPGEYRNRTIQSSVAEQLSQEGVELHAGESVRYLITDYYSKSPERRAAADALVEGGTLYDTGRYIELLAEVCSTVLEPFDGRCSAPRLISRLQNMELGLSNDETWM